MPTNLESKNEKWKILSFFYKLLINISLISIGQCDYI